ncbi:hypothetical protein HYW94_00845 [Candidatus Uhrbacteria bacterium]|nr:hypothetical protein [Candidatus Uhrbacteria bacterium]
MYEVAVKIQGSAPLLMHKFSMEATAELEGTVKSRKTGPPLPEVEAEQGAYRLDPANGDKKGQLCVPGEHVYQTMVKAASSFQVKGQGKKTFKDPVKGGVGVFPEYSGITNLKGEKLYDYAIDKRPARIGTARVLRARPRLEEWCTEFTLSVLDERILPVEVLQSILVRAGQHNGIGDYRPRFGKFIVTKFDVLKYEEEKDLVFEALVLPSESESDTEESAA